MRVRLHACLHCVAVRTRRMQGLLMHGLQQPFDPESVTCAATAVAQLGSLFVTVEFAWLAMACIVPSC
jgi:hypothetical protein